MHWPAIPNLHYVLVVHSVCVVLAAPSLRFIDEGDTAVATHAVDEDGVDHAALMYGWRAEAFLVDGDGADRVKKCVHGAF